MKAQTIVNAFNQTLAQRNRLFLVLGVSGLMNILLGISNFAMMGKERIVVVPPVVSHEFWIASDSDSFHESK
jgi:ABC-type sugar transport system substrate-binding protein